MTILREPIWLEAQLYYEEPWEDFLINIIKPYCDTALNTSAIERYFFIRYWERGPHIRLRFYGEKQTIEKIVKDNLDGYFNNFFQMTPSHREEPHYPPNTLTEHFWHPNNSVQYVNYQPEIERYAGQYGLEIAEKHFFESSKAVLASMALAGSKNWTYEQALGTAIKLHLAFVHALGFDLKTASIFFKEVFHYWLPLSIQRERINKAQRDQQNETMIHTFEQFFTEQADSLISFHAAFWGILTQEEELSFDEDYLNDWHAACRFCRQEIMLAQAQSLLQDRPPKFQISFSTTLEESEYLVWELYADFFHMTNNRLGILNRDESYLAYLMMRSMEHLIAE